MWSFSTSASHCLDRSISAHLLCVTNLTNGLCSPNHRGRHVGVLLGVSQHVCFCVCLTAAVYRIYLLCLLKGLRSGFTFNKRTVNTQGEEKLRQLHVLEDLPTLLHCWRNGPLHHTNTSRPYLKIHIFLSCLQSRRVLSHCVSLSVSFCSRLLCLLSMTTARDRQEEERKRLGGPRAK